MQNVNIGVIGGGSWGTALAILLLNNGHNVDIWMRDSLQIQHVNEFHENKKYLPGITIPSNLKLTNDISKVIHDKQVIVLAIPSHGVRQILNDAKNIVDKDQVIVNVAKGIENNTLLRISQIVEEILPHNPYAVLSGPSHAEEVARNIPTAVVSASKDKEVAEYVQDIFMSSYFRVYTNLDVVGVELGGSLKNVIALGAGISDGLGYGDNTKAALMTRGIIEMARLGKKMGANSATFSGLSGIGDLIVTCTSMHSRNRKAGILIGQGKSLEEAINSVGMVVEGIKTAKSAYELAKREQVVMPITEEIYEVLYEGKDVKNSVNNLMLRDKKPEMEEIIRE
ncbi:glycerol 3-phosphate dehydrogenase (NAD(P)+) [Keratinibaculum paraultunense]|uniref:Glycerol-3-phosphate dehydrogenase [NAD(P)+] n=1 Tax=Keratinibaculum paraultunense TaxID=1278232 RepID=A0A4R3KVD9_9FIRM|nr:NAD(P)H-dependent glycerol-3-phosphate dehydrogenase [Keratinibaculum paraultunense]QQY78742.1 NAD(P)H-dependent glycerol-3-phosphate dehydrogenase [Keratinibaculum paraultunense]TCS89579.1 glycerol 3-phosphate dehydrogenase (NAD(P)+) [Keratinibaculum paraultunense]